MNRVSASLIALLAVLAVVTLVLVRPTEGTGRAAPTPSHIFHGSVKIGGTDAPDGTVVQARINGVAFSKCATTGGNPTSCTTSGGNYGIATQFLVPGDDPDTQGTKEGGVAGDPIVFFVSGVQASMVLNGVSAASVPFAVGVSNTVDLSIAEVNDAPSFTKGADQTVLEDAGAQTVLNWATNLSPGPIDEAAQALNFIVSNNNNALFSVQPAIAANGTLTYTPAANANGSAIVTVQIHDDGGTANGGVDTSPAQTFNINVTPVNDAPSFTKGADQTVLEDAGVQTVAGWATNLSPGPASEAGQVLTFIATNNNNALFSAQPAIAANGTLTYTPAANANGAATVTVQIHDDGGTTNGGVDTSPAQTFNINVTAVNDAPVAVNNNYSVQKDTTLNVVTPGVLGNDTDVDGDALTAVLVTGTDPNKGTLALNANGSFTYTPGAGFLGNDSFTYKAQDPSLAQSNTATVTIAVQAGVNAPVAVDDAYSVNEDAVLNVAAAGVLTNDTDADGDTLTAILVTGTDPNKGILTLNPNGSFAYTPNANFNGNDSFTYRANDGAQNSNTATVTITVNSVNDAPSFTKGADQTVQAVAGAQTIANWATSIIPGPADEAAQALNFIVTNNSNALFSAQPAIASNGTLTYTPAANANDQAIVTVRLQDNGGSANGGVDTSPAQTFTITVTSAAGVIVEPTATPTTPTPTPTSTATPTGTPSPQVSAPQTVTASTTIAALAEQLDALQSSVSAVLGAVVQVLKEAPLHISTTADGLVVAIAATGQTPGQQIVGAFNATLGNLTLQTTNGKGTTAVDLGGGLTIESDATLKVTAQGIDVALENPKLVFKPVAPNTAALAGGSADVTNIGADFNVGLKNMPNGASISVQFAKDASAFTASPGVKFRLAAQGVGGTIADPTEDVAFTMKVTKSLITNQDMGDTTMTMTVSTVWHNKKIAEGKGIFITKLDDDGNVVATNPATCVVTGASAKCIATFTGAAGGLSIFGLVAVQPVATPTPTPTTKPPVTGDFTPGSGMLMALLLAGFVLITAGGAYLLHTRPSRVRNS